MRGVYKYQRYLLKYAVCELLTLVNLCFQLYLMNWFLGGMFTEYGSMVASISQMDPEDRSDPMNLVFPKVAKCVFNKYGGSGTVEIYDGLCVLPINIFNEKIYVFMWFWFVILFVSTCLSMIYQLALLIWEPLRARALRTKTHNVINADTANYVVGHIRRGRVVLSHAVGLQHEPRGFRQALLGLGQGSGKHEPEAARSRSSSRRRRRSRSGKRAQRNRRKNRDEQTHLKKTLTTRF